jgi:uncharacterized protein YciI
MTRWAAICEDNGPEVAAPIRERYLADHLAYLEAHRDRIVLAGALRTDEAAMPSGGLWVIETPTREEAAAIIEADPFYVHGLRKSYKLLLWGKAPFYGDVTL